TEVVGRHFADFLTTESARRLHQVTLTRVLLGPGHAEGIEVHVRRSDGSFIALMLSLSAEHDASGELVRILGFLVEADPGAGDAARLRQRDTWLRAILDNAPVEIVLKDREGRL